MGMGAPIFIDSACEAGTNESEPSRHAATAHRRRHPIVTGEVMTVSPDLTRCGCIPCLASTIGTALEDNNSADSHHSPHEAIWPSSGCRQMRYKEFGRRFGNCEGREYAHMKEKHAEPRPPVGDHSTDGNALVRSRA